MGQSSGKSKQTRPQQHQTQPISNADRNLAANLIYLIKTMHNDPTLYSGSSAAHNNHNAQRDGPNLFCVLPLFCTDGQIITSTSNYLWQQHSTVALNFLSSPFEQQQPPPPAPLASSPDGGGGGGAMASLRPRAKPPAVPLNLCPVLFQSRTKIYEVYFSFDFTFKSLLVRFAQPRIALNNVILYPFTVRIKTRLYFDNVFHTDGFRMMQGSLHANRQHQRQDWVAEKTQKDDVKAVAAAFGMEKFADEVNMAETDENWEMITVHDDNWQEMCEFESDIVSDNSAPVFWIKLEIWQEPDREELKSRRASKLIVPTLAERASSEISSPYSDKL